ncbi:YifB family Mg chelatase-like AAA ATPase [Kineococcus indalonis]|uniref:YifB family Mg chelatase-like AAA ATPase n=1 Tax=Kineococcus indalonis TaxID=2696566 RepID=UPI0014129071|nr:YifB family Mg chelatase-like AAA ATPase [Kineococcus indalonis]NAZ86818.1 YifB family Mg chelatase-like AAA ATPase [Kineococcus indalonis]
MALARALAVGLVGLDGHLVQVEADISPGLPAFVLVGLPDASLHEAKDRVRAATANSGCPLPQQRITVNLSPATLPKSGSGFDLAVAVAALTASGVLPADASAGAVHLGELGLDGSVRAVDGVLPAVLAAARAGVRSVVVPAATAEEAALVPGVRVRGVRWLAELVADYRGDPPPELPEPPLAPAPPAAGAARPAPDLADVVGQGDARFALEVAAAGAHHLLMSGPPGAGKTMLAARLPGLLPDLDEQAALEVTAVHSVAGALRSRPGAGALITRPPYEDPHHTASVASVVGGGSGVPRPGAASRAHRGVLFLDEAPEFEARVLEALRQPLEQGELVLHRARGAARYPARFQLVLAANPCPCGRAVGRGLECTCTAQARRRYAAKLSGPLLDRVDVRVDVRAVTRAQVAEGAAGEDTAAVAARVRAARALAAERLSPHGARCNGELRGPLLRGALRLPPSVTVDLDRAMERGALTLRGLDRVLRVAWTVADLRGAPAPDRDDVGRALALRGVPGAVPGAAA